MIPEMRLVKGRGKMSTIRGNFQLHLDVQEEEQSKTVGSGVFCLDLL